MILILNLLPRSLLEAHLPRLYSGPTAQERSTLIFASLSKVLDCQWDRAEDRPVRVGGVELDSYEVHLVQLDGLAPLDGLDRPSEFAGLAGLAGPVLEQP